jgi:hypothetical protein
LFSSVRSLFECWVLSEPDNWYHELLVLGWKLGGNSVGSQFWVDLFSHGKIPAADLSAIRCISADFRFRLHDVSMCKIALTGLNDTRSTALGCSSTKSSEIMSAPNPKGDQAAAPSWTEIMEVMHTMQQYMQHSETHL